MRIGIDAKWLFRGPPSGRRVVGNLARTLGDAAATSGDELTFFLDERNRGDPLPFEIAHARAEYVWADNNQLSNLLVVPLAANRLALDAVVYQNFVPPRGVARHSRIAFIHDVIFESRPDLFTRRERLYFAPLHYLTRTADRVCTVSESERARLARLGYHDSSRIDVVPNAVDAAFVPRECIPAESIGDAVRRLQLPETFVLYAGRLNARKNVASLVRAMAHVHGKVSLVIAGARDETSGDLMAVASQHGVADRVCLLGPVSDDDLRVLYTTAMAFCFPSLDEGFGLGPLEAMASGTPVVASHIPAVDETCGGAAILVDPNDPAEIGAAVQRLVSSPALRREFRDRGLERAASFSWHRSARRLIDCVHASASTRQASAA